MAVSGTAAAQNTIWDAGAGTNNWYSSGNWSAGVPNGGSRVFIARSGAPFQPLIDAGMTGYASWVHVGYDSATPAPGSLELHDGGQLNVNNSSFLGYSNGTDAGLATVRVTGTGSRWISNDQMVVGFAHTAVMTVDNGGQVNNAIGVLGNTSGAFSGSGFVTVHGTGSLWSSATALSVGQDSLGHMTVTADGTVQVAGGAGAISLAANPTATGTLTIGQQGPFPGAAPGIVDAAQISFGDGDGTLDFNHNASGYVFDLALVGDGSVLNRDGTTIYTGNGSGFTGTTTIEDGRFHVNSQLNGAVDVDGGVLGGTGTAGNVTINAGGTVAPGASIGTLSTAAALFNADSVLEVELNDGGNTAGTNNDLLDVSGAVTINGGTIRVRPENGTDTGSTYTPGLTYTVISGGSVTGQFASVVDDYPLLDFADSYDATGVYLTSSVADICPAGLTQNQNGTCGGVLSTGAGSLLDSVVILPDTELPAALDALSGEIHASTGTVLVEDSRFLREAAFARLRQASPESDPDGTWTMTHSAGAADAPAAAASPYGLWGQAYGAWGSWDGNGNTGRTTRNTGGLFVGGDAPVTEDLRLGLLAGFGQSDIDTDSRYSSGSVDSWHLGAYGGASVGALDIGFGGAFTWHDVDTQRVAAFTGFSDRPAADYGASTAQIFGEASYRFDLGDFSLEPFAGVAHVHVETDDFTEAGGDAALIASGQDLDTTFTTLGLRAGTDIALGDETQVQLSGMLGWQHAFGDVSPTATHSLAGGLPFTVAGVPLAEDAFVIDLGLAIALTPDLDLSLGYDGRFGSGATDQTLRADLVLRF